MKHAITTLFILFITLDLFGQGTSSPKLSTKDSLKLTTTWAIFKKGLELKDRQTLSNLSLKYVYCDLFVEPDPNSTTSPNPYISFKTFLNEFFAHMPKSKLWSVVKNNKYHFSVEDDYWHPKNGKSKKEKLQNVYQIWFITSKPNELQKGHEGQTHAFQFVKVNGEFKFYGMTSIP
jgi:hypothetical protein